MRDYFDELSLKDLMKGYHTEHRVDVDQQDDIDQILWMAQKSDHGAFVDHLSWLAWDKNGKPKGTLFVFPATLTSKERQSIHRLGRADNVFSKTFRGKLHVFVKKLN
jgi:hypothetical protein